MNNVCKVIRKAIFFAKIIYYFIRQLFWKKLLRQTTVPLKVSALEHFSLCKSCKNTFFFFHGSSKSSILKIFVLLNYWRMPLCTSVFF